ncbi:MAG TPA: ATP-binding protein [Archangium sp.]|uniref:ATP-binding protein n=1 Tax=Archangium sp. TaxID=1872627 RepID=UPI002E326B84|nr:ATP-binding protein [Archangium sp.]HEX5745404.1 ATP-binding protein [Archangium sp.]
MARQHESSLPARSSLARSTLINMGVRIAVIIALTTFFSYLHIFYSLRDEALVQLKRNVTERSQREQLLFVLAEDDHAAMKKALEERLQTLSQEDVDARFDELFAPRADGTIRNRRESFDGTRMPGVFVPPGVTADADFRRRLVAAYDVTAQYAPAFHVRFETTGIILPEGAIAGYWPEGANYFQDLEPTFSLEDFEYYTLGLPANNPRRVSAWTSIYEDPPTQTWMVTVATPVDVEGRHVGTITHDVLLNDLMARTINNHMPGAYNILVREDGQLIAHPEMRMKSGEGVYDILKNTGKPEDAAAYVGTAAQRAHLHAIFERVKNQSPEQTVLELPEYDELLGVARLKGPGWYVVTVLSEQVVSAGAFRAARYVLGFGVASLLLELAIMYWVLKQQITRPLMGFTQATARLEAGDFDVQLETSRGDELGQLANAFQRMAGEIHRREEALRQANEGLEQRVEERTRELQDVHRQLVETARQVGRAEIATNVLHNVGNVLNSVLTSTLLARERLGALKLESLEKLAELLEAHRADLPTFLTRDERGKNTLPFLTRLGQYMSEERQELQTLLGDISRHTEHIGAIVKLQQRYARTPQHMFEPVQLGELVEDALRINQAALGRHAVQVERDLATVPPVETEKHKVLMILVNLISNAKYAMDPVPAGQRRLTVSLANLTPGWIHIEVRDNGVGIPPEMLTRIFQYGFTTRSEGHGFGLHSSALAAQELGGSLKAHSPGPGQGATFTLELPLTPEQRGERASA